MKTIFVLIDEIVYHAIYTKHHSGLNLKEDFSFTYKLPFCGPSISRWGWGGTT